MYVRHRWLYPTAMALIAATLLLFIAVSIVSWRVDAREIIPVAVLLIWTVIITRTRRAQIAAAREAGAQAGGVNAVAIAPAAERKRQDIPWQAALMIVAIVLAPFVIAGVAVWDSYHDDGARCATGDSDSMILACTALILSSKLNAENRAHAFNNRGHAYNDKGQYDRAIEDLNEAIRIKPDYVYALFNRVVAYTKKGMYDRAVDDLNRVIKLQPTSAVAFAGRGAFHQRKGRYDDAIADYDQAIRLKPDFAEAFEIRGSAFEDEGQHALAIRDYDEAIRLKPDDDDAFSGRGVALFAAGRFDAAAADFAAAVKLRPSNAYWHLWLFLSQAKLSGPDATELQRAAGRLDLVKWPGPLVSLYLGNATEGEVRSAATNAVNDEIRTEQACAAAFYIAEYGSLLRDGRDDRDRRERDKARLREAAETCPPGIFERAGAIAELNRVQ